MAKSTKKRISNSKAEKSADYDFFRVAFTLAIMVVVSVAMVFTLASYSGVQAQESAGTISGYAWSDNIGWVSFSGVDYELAVSDTGTISGYAWSDNIGWISANTSDLSGCPSSPCSAYFDEDGKLSGWLKALAANDSQSGGWDGFISLSGDDYGPEKTSDGSFSGYAWGSDVVGWLDFAYASTDYAVAPTADLVVRKIGDEEWSTSLVIQPTDEIEIGWNQDGSANTTSCSSIPQTYGFSTGGEVSGIDSDIEEPIGNTSADYRLLCIGPGDNQAIDTVTVSTIGGEGAEFIPCPGQTVLPDIVRRGANVEICWALGTNDADACSLKAGGVEIASPSEGIVSYSHNIVGEVDFTLQCIGGNSDTFRVRSVIEAQET